MDKYPLLWAGRALGELTVEREGLYTRFTARCRLPEQEGLWCAWAVGECGELRLGVLEPRGEQAEIRRRFSGQMTAPLGTLRRAELRPAGEKASPAWEAPAEPEGLFRTPWLRQRLRGVKGVLTRREGERRYLALPYEPGAPFPLEPLFCLAGVRRMGEGTYVVYAFDRREWPVLPEEEKR